MQKLKCDTANIQGFEETSWGGLRIFGTIAQVGWLTYYEDDGTKRFEYVSPEVLFEDEHLRTIEGSPITLDHPPENINPQNWSTYAKGQSGSKSNLDKRGQTLYQWVINQLISNIQKRELITGDKQKDAAII